MVLERARLPYSSWCSGILALLVVSMMFFIFYFLQKKHTPFDGTKQQGSDEIMAGVGERQGQLDRPWSRLHCNPSAPQKQKNYRKYAGGGG